MVVSIPLRSYREVPVEPLAGKIVIDTNNYYWQRDGHIAELDDGATTSAGLLQEHLPTVPSGQGVQPHSIHRARRGRHPRRHAGPPGAGHRR